MSDIPKIKRNIAKMIDQGAQESEIDSYVASEGVSLDQLQAPAGPANFDGLPSTTASMAQDVYGMEQNIARPSGLLPLPARTSYDKDNPDPTPIDWSDWTAPSWIHELAKVSMVPAADLRTPEDMIMTAATLGPLGAASRVKGSLFAPKSAYKTATPKAPTRPALKEATTAGYNEARAMGAEYTPSSIKNWADDVAMKLDAEGRIAENYPKVHGLLNKLRTPPEGATSIRLESVDSLYKELGRLGGNADEGVVANIVQKSLDDFHTALDPSALVAGTATPQQAAKVLKEARGNAAAGFRSDRITGLEKTAQRRTAAANSGRNTDNAIRQRLASLIESQKGSRGLTKEEMSAIDDVIMGTPSKNAARYFGNLLGGGGGLGSTLLSAGAAAGGAATMGPAGAILGMIPPAIGAGSRGIANSISKKELTMLDEMMRSRSPLAAKAQTQQVYSPSLAQEQMIKTLGAQAAPQTKPIRQQQLSPDMMMRILVGGQI